MKKVNTSVVNKHIVFLKDDQGYQEIRIIRKVGFALSGRRRGRVRPRPVNIG